MRGIGKVVALLFAVAAFALVLSGSLAANPSPAATAGTAVNSTTYQDSTGENPAAPDISTVAVSNDDAGNVTLAVSFANRTAAVSTELYGVDLDTDRNPATGDQPFGTDYSILLMAGTSLLGRWDPVAQEFVVAPMTTLTTSWAGSTLTIRSSTKELGNTTGFRFMAYAFAVAGEDVVWDTAPDVGRDLWAYEVKLYVAPVLAVTKIDCLPEPGIAGRQLTGFANVRVTRAGVPETLGTKATVKWQATVGRVALKPVTTTVTRVAAGGVARVKYKLPKAIKAKSVRVKVTVTMEGITVTKSHTHRIR